jgi:hypothetical protein
VNSNTLLKLFDLSVFSGVPNLQRLQHSQVRLFDSVKHLKLVPMNHINLRQRNVYFLPFGVEFECLVGSFTSIEDALLSLSHIYRSLSDILALC